jgi:GAF domain-containing protein
MVTDNQMGQPQRPQSSEQQILLLGQVLHSLREEDNLDFLIKTTVTYLLEQFEYQLIWLALYDPLNHTLYGKGGWNPDNDHNVLQRNIRLYEGNLLEQVVNEQCPVGVSNLQAETRIPEWQEVAAQYNIQGTIILPIRYKNNLLGLVLLGSERWGYLLKGELRAKLFIVIGELGVVLAQKDRSSRFSKSPTDSLLKLLENIRSLGSLNKRLEAVVEAAHQFVAPSRTNIYWLEREGRYFWCRMSNHLINMGRDLSNPSAATAGITVQELSDFYYALAVNQVVWVTETGSSLKSHFKDKLLQRLGVRAVLAAPIIWQKDLLGFLSVESHEQRIWSEAEMSFVQAASGLISLVAPTDSMETTIRQIQQDTQLTQQVTQTIYKEQDIDASLHICAARLLERLTATRFVLLEYDANQKSYEIIFQSVRPNRRNLNLSLGELSEVDIQLLQNAKQALEIENFEEDLRLLNWRKQLLENTVRSLLICNCTQGRAPELLLLITHDSHRSWKNLEKELLWVFGQNLGVVIRHWQMRTFSEDQHKIAQTAKKYLDILTNSEQNITTTAAIKQIASVLGCPFGFMLSWSPEDQEASILRGVCTDNQFTLLADAKINIKQEAIIHWATHQDGYLTFNFEDLPPDTRQWLQIPPKSQVFCMALRINPQQPVTDVVVLADYGQNRWSESTLNAAVTFILQLSWWQHQQRVIEKLEASKEELQRLNWYKHRRLEEIYRMAALLVSQLRDLGVPRNELTQMRYKLLMRQLEYTTNSMVSVIKHEQWQLYMTSETMSVSSLWKRALERVDNLVQQRQLWIGVHGLGQNNEDRELQKNSSSSTNFLIAANKSTMSISGDILKIELVIYELLIAACERSPIGDKIDIWCRPLDESNLEILMTDNGSMEPELLAILNLEASKSSLSLDNIQHKQITHLLICQHIINQLGGQLQIYKLDDNRLVSRLVLPLSLQTQTGELNSSLSI